MKDCVFDQEALPKRPMLDANVFMDAIRDADSENTRIASQLCNELRRSKATILLCAPVLAEVMRRPGNVPPMSWFHVVPFDARAVGLLNERLPWSEIQKAREDHPQHSCLKFDSLVVACAIRHNADVLITRDARLTALATRAGVATCAPPGFLAKQTSLDL